MSGDKTPVKSAILNRFDLVPKIVELANYKKNININPFAPEPPVTVRADPGPFYPL